MLADIKSGENKDVLQELRKDLISKAETIIEKEAFSIMSQKSALSEEFYKACILLAGCKGKIAVCGIGKSAIMARKISATMSSVGLPSFFISPVDACHGDAGALCHSDVCIALSYSGETSEMKNFVNFINSEGYPLIAITAERKSFLASRADHAIVLNKVEEACPLGLAPSSSTSAMLAVGDALAFCSSYLKGFDEKEFARRHPAGMLGKKTNSIVADFMKKGEDCPMVHEDASLAEAIEKMTKTRTGSVCIVGENDMLLGFFTDGDLRRIVRKKNIKLTEKISAYMNRAPKCITFDKSSGEALKIMYSGGFDNMPVTDYGGKLVGLIDERDLIRL